MSLQIELRDCADSVTIARSGLLREAADALDALTAERDHYKALSDQHFNQAMENGARAAALGAKNAALKADAERYRWLRVHGETMIGPDRGIGPEWTYGKELDAAIDKAKQ